LRGRDCSEAGSKNGYDREIIKMCESAKDVQRHCNFETLKADIPLSADFFIKL
jgi:hypothetical protein